MSALEARANFTVRTIFGELWADGRNGAVGLDFSRESHGKTDPARRQDPQQTRKKEQPLRLERAKSCDRVPEDWEEHFAGNKEKAKG